MRDLIVSLKGILKDLMPRDQEHGLLVQGRIAKVYSKMPSVTYGRIGSTDQPVHVGSKGHFELTAPAKGVLCIRISTSKYFVRVVEISAVNITEDGRYALAREAIDLDILLKDMQLSKLVSKSSATAFPINRTGVSVKIYDELKPVPESEIEWATLLHNAAVKVAAIA